MVVVKVECPKCSSDQVAPTWYTPASMQCIPCGHEFDARGGFWKRLRATLFGAR